MRIAYVCADRGVAAFDWKKGCSIHVQEVLRAFRQQGHTVDLYASNIAGEVPDDLQDIEIHHLPVPARHLERAAREQAQIRSNQHLHTVLEHAGPYDLVYERYSLWSFAAMEYAAAQGIPGVLEVNSPLIEEQNEFRGLVDRRGAHHVAERCFSAASSICAVSDRVREYLVSNFDVRDNIIVIPNGVDPDRFSEAFDSRQPRSSRFTVGFVGSLKPWHGVDGLVDAFAAFLPHAPSSELLIVGDGPERPAIEAQIARLNIDDAVTLAGSLRPRNIPNALAMMDIGVAPYPKLVNHYFSPMKVFEYMAASLPVVVTSAGQLGDIIKDECDGLLCEPGDIAALSDAFKCLQRDPALRMRLGRTARRKILKEHTWRNVARRVLQFSERNPPSAERGFACVAP